METLRHVNVSNHQIDVCSTDCQVNSRWLVDSHQKGPVMRKIFVCHDVAIFIIPQWTANGAGGPSGVIVTSNVVPVRQRVAGLVISLRRWGRECPVQIRQRNYVAVKWTRVQVKWPVWLCFACEGDGNDFEFILISRARQRMIVTEALVWILDPCDLTSCILKEIRWKPRAVRMQSLASLVALTLW